MAWIEVHQSLLTHRKTMRLCRLLHMDKFAVTGRLIALWSWAMDSAPEGAIPLRDIDFVAEVTGWDGEPQDLIDALVSAGYLDPTDDGYVIHDWWEYIGKLMEEKEKKREQNAARQANYRERQKARKEYPSESEESNALRNALRNAPTVPNLTKPNRNTSVTSYVTSLYQNSANAAKPRSTPPHKSPATPATKPLDVIMAKVPSSTKQKFSAEEIQKQFDRAMVWVSEEESRFMSAKFFTDWLEREVDQGHIIPDNLSEVERLQRIMAKKPDEKGLIDGQTYHVWQGQLRKAKQLAEDHAYEERCREREALDALYAGNETAVVPDQSSNHKTPS